MQAIRSLKRRHMLALFAPLGLVLATAPDVLGQTDGISDWRPVEFEHQWPNSFHIVLHGAYRLARAAGKLTTLEFRLDQGALDIDPVQVGKMTPSKLQTFAAYRLPDKTMFLVPGHQWAVAKQEPSAYQVRRASDTHFDLSGPVRTISLASEDQDIGKYFLYATLFTQDGYIPASSKAFLKP